MQCWLYKESGTLTVRGCSYECTHSWRTGEREDSLQIVSGEGRAFLFLIDLHHSGFKQEMLLSSKEYIGENRLN